MAGRQPKIAFVASGGAAKGIAHLGVLKAAEELGIGFDLYVGSSSGAVVCAAVSQGISVDRIVDSLRPGYLRRYRGGSLRYGTFFDLSLPRSWEGWRYLCSGIFQLDRLEAFLRDRLPKNDFRRVDKELYVVATDLDTTERVVFGKGYEEHVPISQAVCASCAIPVLFRPYKIDGHYYIDGEIKRTLSADIAIERGADVLVISNVYTPRVTPRGERSIAHRGPLQVGRQAVNILLHEKSLRGLDLYDRIYPNARILFLEAEIGHLGFFNLLEARKLLKASYVEALKKLAAAKALGVFDGQEVPQAKLRAI
jgi:NTE family protein